MCQNTTHALTKNQTKNRIHRSPCPNHHCNWVDSEPLRLGWWCGQGRHRGRSQTVARATDRRSTAPRPWDHRYQANPWSWNSLGMGIAGKHAARGNGHCWRNPCLCRITATRLVCRTDRLSHRSPKHIAWPRPMFTAVQPLASCPARCWTRWRLATSAWAMRKPLLSATMRPASWRF